MFKFNYKTTLWLMAIAIMVISMMFIVEDATAVENESYVVVDNFTNIDSASTPVNPVVDEIDYASIERISQGQCVEIGKRYDISGIGWWTGFIGYYGMYTDDFSPSNVSLKQIKEIPYAIGKLKTFYVSENEFGAFPGFWYVMYDMGKEPAANNRLFYVSKKCEVSPQVINVTPKKANATQLIQEVDLPPKYDTGFVLARGDPLYIREDGDTTEWIFGRETGIYDRKNTDGFAKILPEDLINAEVGTYKLVIQYPGNNSIYEAEYTPEYKPEKYSSVRYPAITSPFVKGNIININGMQPMLVYTTLMEYVRGTIDDSTKTYNIEFSEPNIQIKRLDATVLNDNRTFMQIRGYTNMKAGTKLTITVDSYQSNSKFKTNDVFYATVKKTGTGELNEWRQFNVVIPLDYGNKAPGQHFMTVSADNGAIATVPFYIRKELPVHYQQPEYIQFVDNSPFIPPVYINTTVTVEVPKIIIQEKIVKEEVNYDKLAEETFWKGAPIVLAGLGALLLMIYMVSVIVRTYERRKQSKKEE